VPTSGVGSSGLIILELGLADQVHSRSLVDKERAAPNTPRGTTRDLHVFYTHGGCSSESDGASSTSGVALRNVDSLKKDRGG
jgi:hypothetical protein